jgi:acetyltransferase-like isoleucine patch superfamily enzyme
MLPMPLGVRAYLYRLSGIAIGDHVWIDRNLQVTHAHKIKIGNRVTIANGVSLLAEVTAGHSRLEQQYKMYKSKEIVIEDDVYIGVKATILPGVRVGRMTTIGANTVVLSNVPPYAVVLGVPGRVIMVREPPAAADFTGETR